MRTQSPNGTIQTELAELKERSHKSIFVDADAFRVIYRDKGQDILLETGNLRFDRTKIVSIGDTQIQSMFNPTLCQLSMVIQTLDYRLVRTTR